jgi:hypothetical protein
MRDSVLVAVPAAPIAQEGNALIALAIVSLGGTCPPLPGRS